MHEQDIGFFAPEYQKILGKRKNMLTQLQLKKCAMLVTRSKGKTAKWLILVVVCSVLYFHGFLRMKAGCNDVCLQFDAIYFCSDDAETLQAEYKKQPCHLERLYGIL